MNLYSDWRIIDKCFAPLRWLVSRVFGLWLLYLVVNAPKYVWGLEWENGKQTLTSPSTETIWAIVQVGNLKSLSVNKATTGKSVFYANFGV